MVEFFVYFAVFVAYIVGCWVHFDLSSDSKDTPKGFLTIAFYPALIFLLLVSIVLRKMIIRD